MDYKYLMMMEINNFTNNSFHVAELNGMNVTPAYAQAIIIVMYTTITVLAVGGNIIVCYIVLAYQRMRTVTNFFIFNLACSDILMAVLCIPFSFIANVLVHYWPFPDIMCPMVTYVQTLAVFLSAFTLVAISLDRYRAIIFPLRPRMARTQALVSIVVIWLLSLAVPLPIAIVSHMAPMSNSSDVKLCIEDWPQDRHCYIYSFVILILQYFLPLFVLLFTYTSIAIVMWGKKAPGEAQNSRDERMAAAKRKMVKMMIIVVIIYALCWLPLHVIILVGDSYPSIWRVPYIQLLWTACHWLAMSNSCYNPIVYCWMNSRYRSGFCYVLRCCPCVNYQSEQHSPERFQRMNTHVSTLRSHSSDRRVVCTNTYSTQDSPFSHRNCKSPHYSKESISLNSMDNGSSNVNSSENKNTFYNK